MGRRLIIMPGDGIGQEVVPPAAGILQRLMPELELIEVPAGWGAFERYGASVPERSLDAVRAAGAALFGAVQSPTRRVVGYRSAVLTLRQELGLFANLRPVRSADGQVDLLLVRENTEGLYVGEEHETGEGVAEATRRITRVASRRIARLAAELARTRRGRVTIVHKANVLPLTDGLFRDSAREAIGEVDGSIEIEELLVDIAAYHIAANPSRFDVIVTTNLFGDILADLAAVHAGGMGVVPSLNLGQGIAIAEPVHGSAPDIAGQGIANPMATIRSAALLLRHHWEAPALAERLERACDLAARRAPTPDLGGGATTAAFVAAVTEALQT